MLAARNTSAQISAQGVEAPALTNEGMQTEKHAMPLRAQRRRRGPSPKELGHLQASPSPREAVEDALDDLAEAAHHGHDAMAAGTALLPGTRKLSMI